MSAIGRCTPAHAPHTPDGGTSGPSAGGCAAASVAASVTPRQATVKQDGQTPAGPAPPGLRAAPAEDTHTPTPTSRAGLLASTTKVLARRAGVSTEGMEILDLFTSLLSESMLEFSTTDASMMQSLIPFDRDLLDLIGSFLVEGSGMAGLFPTANAIVSFLLHHYSPSLPGAMPGSNTEPPGLGGFGAAPPQPPAPPTPSESSGPAYGALGTAHGGSVPRLPLITASNAHLYVMEPPFWAELDGVLYKSGAIENQPWTSMLAVAPMNVDSIRARPLPSAREFEHCLKEAVKAPTAWPSSRQSFLHAAAMHYIFSAVNEMNSGGSTVSGANAGATEVNRMFQSGALFFKEFNADAVSARRTANLDVQEGAREFVASLDRYFAPNDDAAYLDWTNALPQPGMTARAYFNLLRGLAVQQGRDWTELHQRFSCAVRQASVNSTDSHANQGHFVVGMAFRAIVANCHTAADATRRINCDEEFKAILVPARRERAPRQPDTLVAEARAGSGEKSRVLRTAYNLVELYATLDKLGEPLGKVPPCVPTDSCPFCLKMGITCVGKYAPSRTLDNTKEAFEHNPWRCRFLKPFVEGVVTRHPGKVTVENLLRTVDNPGAIATAHLG